MLERGIPRFFKRQSMTIDELRPVLCDYRLVIDWPMPIDWFSFLMRYVFSQDFQKHGLFMHFNDENCDKTLFLLEK